MPPSRTWPKASVAPPNSLTMSPSFGVAAIDAVNDGDFGKMVALRGTEIVRVPLDVALAEPKLLDAALYETAEVFFG